MEIKDKIWKWVCCVLAAGLMVSAPVWAGEGDGISSKEVKIGVLTALTGPAALYGKECASAVQLYFKMTNEKGGINGRQVKVIPVDGAWNPATAVGAMKTLIYQDKVFVANTFGSQATTSTYNIIRRNNLPVQVIGPVNTLYNPPRKQVFCVETSYKTETIVGVKYIMDTLKPKDPNFAIIYIDDVGGRGSLDGLRSALNIYGLKPVSEQSYSRGTTDFSSQLINLQKAGADYVILWALTGEVVQILKQAKALNYKPQFVGLSPCTTNKLIQLAGDDAEGFFTISHTALTDEDVPGMKLIREIAQKYDMAPGITPYYYHSWAMAKVWDTAIPMAEKAGNLTRTGVIKAMEGIRDLDTGGILPPISFSPTQHQAGTMARVTRVDMKSKRFVPATGWIEAAF
ncbi:MAG: ABC transporter substrate-binding protein [Desulfobacteraceae bacterium]|jgi:ABC-type branched-subunit amino acid transport system substrate-binding protein